MTKNQKIKKAKFLQPEISQAIAKLNFFDSFSEELKHEISQKSKLVVYEVGSKILIQGQINNDLHILVDGSLSVLVDDQLVAQLNKKGDLIGEMSVISKEPVAATICANVKTSILTISANDLDNLNGASNDAFQHGLYRIYANDLSNKLKITNQKAKFFEELTEKLTVAQGELTKINLDLEEKVKARTKDLIEQSKNLEISHQKLEQKNTELLNSHKKIEELYSNRETTFQKLESLYRNSLIPLQLTLLQLEEESLSSNQSHLVKGATEELKEVVNLLEPITQVYYTEKAIKSKSVLLVEPNKNSKF